MDERRRIRSSCRRAVSSALTVLVAAALAGCELLTQVGGRTYGACGVYPAVPLEAHRSAHRAADYYDQVLLPEATSREDRRELRREARHSPFFLFFRPNESLTLQGRSHEHRYLVRVEDGFGEYWTHENELSGLEAFCPHDEP